MTDTKGTNYKNVINNEMWVGTIKLTTEILI